MCNDNLALIMLIVLFVIMVEVGFLVGAKFGEWKAASDIANGKIK